MQFPIAKIVKPHGVRGELKVLPLKEVYFSLIKDQLSFMIDDKKYAKSQIKAHRQGFIIKLENVADMDAAEKLRNKQLSVEEVIVSAFLEKEGIFFAEEWVGYTVISDKGEALGEVVELLYTGANDVLVVKSDSEEHLVPVVDDFLLNVNSEEKKLMVVKPEFDQ